MDQQAEVEQSLAQFRAFDAYTLGDAARRAGSGGVLHHLKPQTADTRFVGRALTARIWREPHKTIPLKDWGGAQLREQTRPGDVVLLDGGGLMLSAMGELAFANLTRLGAAGVVVNGAVRDVDQLEQLQLGLPVFALGAAITSVAGNGRIIDVKGTLYIEGLRICHGDLIAGCRGGIVIIPWEDRQAVLKEARTIADSDRLVRDGLARGESISTLWAAHK